MQKFFGVLSVLVATLILAGTAAAAPVDPMAEGVFDGKIPCQMNSGIVACNGPGGNSNAPASTVPSWDGTPIDVNFALPDPAEFGNGPFPLAMYFHGFGGGKEGFGGDSFLRRFAEQGFAAFSMTDRGFKSSCGKPEAITALTQAPPAGYGAAACDDGFIHLMDIRYEVRDAQYFAGLLADEGLIIPDKIGSVGASYGGGKSANLAMLKNRIMLPDGSLAPWKSAGGIDMELAVAAPIVPWTDFAYSLMPNGETLDYTVENAYGPQNEDGTFTDDAKFGSAKAGLITGLFPSGDNFSGDHGYTAKSDWDIRNWKDMMFAGEPYEPVLAKQVMNEMTLHHSSYYIDDSVEPAPMVIAQGLTDDLFPPSEATRLYNKVKAKYPTATVKLAFADIGHPRTPPFGPHAQGRDMDKEMGYQLVDGWFSYFLKDEGAAPDQKFEAAAQVCPYDDPSTRHEAPTWADFGKGEMRKTLPGTHVLDKDGGNDQVSAAFIDLYDACKTISETPEDGIITIDFPTAPAGGYMVGGATTVIADIESPNGSQSQIAARLFEIHNGQERLIARGFYKPDATGRQVFQLHGNVYRFPEGSFARVQLLPRDAYKDPNQQIMAYVRASNVQQDITLKNIDVRIGMNEEPGSLGGLITKPAPKVLPEGRTLAADFDSYGSVEVDKSWPQAVKKPGKIGAFKVQPKQRAVKKGKKVVLKLRVKNVGGKVLKGKVNIKAPKGKVKVKKAVQLNVKPGKVKVYKVPVTVKKTRKAKGQAKVVFQSVKQKGKKAVAKIKIRK